ncbi:MAG: hypothetical protein AABW48_04925 [Nanoarchaeota archaeon]
MSLFEKCKENIIDGRRVYVCSKATGYLETYNQRIVQICSTKRIAKFFPALWFSLERYSNKELPSVSPAYVLSDEIYRGIAKIHLVPNKIQNFKTFETYIIHELTHLWHAQQSGWVKTRAHSHMRLFRATQKILFEEFQGASLPTIRRMLFLFVWSLYVEGIALFNQRLNEEEIEFTDSFFLSNYKDSRECARKITKSFLELSQNPKNKELPYDFQNEQIRKKIIDRLKLDYYIIAVHMVFSLLYLDPNLNITKIAKMNHFTFVKKYEACMLKLNYKPAVSLTSGAGDFDYKRSLQQWWNAVKR